VSRTWDSTDRGLLVFNGMADAEDPEKATHFAFCARANAASKRHFPELVLGPVRCLHFPIWFAGPLSDYAARKPVGRVTTLEAGAVLEVTLTFHRSDLARAGPAALLSDRLPGALDRMIASRAFAGRAADTAALAPRIAAFVADIV